MNIGFFALLISPICFDAEQYAVQVMKNLIVIENKHNAFAHL